VKIYDKKNDRILKSVTIYLTPEEAHELADSANILYKEPSNHHSHIANKDYTVEVTIAVYTPENIKQFDSKSRKILSDEIE